MTREEMISEFVALFVRTADRQDAIFALDYMMKVAESDGAQQVCARLLHKLKELRGGLS